MGIGNQNIWDKGIGDPATQMLMQSSSNTTPSNAHNFNQALSGPNDPVQPAATATPAAPATPAQPAMSGGGVQAMSGGGQQQQQKKAPTSYYENLKRYQLEVQQLQQNIAMANSMGGQFGGLSVGQLQNKLQHTMQYLQQWQSAVSKLEGV